MTDFIEFQKIARLSRNCAITEKIDGTNAVVYIGEDGEFLTGSRNRWITPDDDNFGFARWAYERKDELLALGPGRHYGEWWGAGIQRRYGLPDKRFSLFNVGRWMETPPPACCSLVPLLYSGIFTSTAADDAIALLRDKGSIAAPGFMEPEGIVIYQTAGRIYFKKTIKGDEEGKHADGQIVVPKVPRPPKDPSKGGRRIEQLPYAGPDKRNSLIAHLGEQRPRKAQGVVQIHGGEPA